MAKRKQFSDELRNAVKNARESRYRIAKETGIAESILSRFVNGKAGLSMEFVDRLYDHLGLEVVFPVAGKGIKSKGK
jgi:transcriptional regulator with XRE-family HTH domain